MSLKHEGTDHLSVPTVHSNGTDGKVLFDEYTIAIDAIRDAREALKLVQPNGRDYFIGAFEVQDAIEQHVRRDAWLLAAEYELEVIRESIQDQIDTPRFPRIARKEEV